MNDTEQNDSGREPTFTESMRMILHTAPKTIKKFLREKKYEQIVSEISKSYKLSKYQADFFERELLLMLLGTETAKGFSDALENIARISKNEVRQIFFELNHLVFEPMHIKIENPVEEEVPSKDSLQEANIPSLPGQDSKKAEEFIQKKPTIQRDKEGPENALPKNAETQTEPDQENTPKTFKKPLVKEYAVDPYHEPIEE